MIQIFRIIAILEGISFLLLMGVGMPLKYIAEKPQAVLYMGWVHGLLFILYMIILWIVYIQYKWSFKKAFYAFIASILPFGTFVFDRKMLSSEK